MVNTRQVWIKVKWESRRKCFNVILTKKSNSSSDLALIMSSSISFVNKLRFSKSFNIVCARARIFWIWLKVIFISRIWSGLKSPINSRRYRHIKGIVFSSLNSLMIFELVMRSISCISANSCSSDHLWSLLFVAIAWRRFDLIFSAIGTTFNSPSASSESDSFFSVTLYFLSLALFIRFVIRFELPVLCSLQKKFRLQHNSTN